ncbi:MAG: NAD-dependent dehydratase [Desulfobacterium sp.]|nr:NAD-dependent dehydratase [Desulfobacterium sp.]
MMKTFEEVIAVDLEYMYQILEEDFRHLANKNVLITGGAGFLGYYLVQFILYWNEKAGKGSKIYLTVYDNYIRGIPDWLDNLKGNPYLTLKKQDITKPLPQDIGDFQYIIHAASIASPTFYRKYPIETMDANVNGLRSLLDYCLLQQRNQKAVEGFLFFSSSEIYGDPTPDNIPTSEEYKGYVSCTGPRACYDESKRYGETLCVNFASRYDLPIKVARPFNNYGPGLKISDRRVIPDFVRDVLAGNDIVMLSDGSPQRTFCYVADAVAGYFKILILGKPGEAYNIGLEKPEISMKELAETIVDLSRDLFDYQGKVIVQTSKDKDYLVDNPNRRCPRIEKAKKQLGYNPSIPLKEGLRRSLIWYQGNQDEEEK